MTSPDTVTDRRRSVPALIAGWIGLAAHLATVFLYLSSGLVVPAWALAMLLLIWVALLGLAIRLLRTRPAFALLVPVAAFVIWYAVILAGGAWLGWTA
jgi:hypothetical protein